jgi:hypothetical protein
VTHDELRALIRRGYRRAQDILGARPERPDKDIVAGTLAEMSLDDQVLDDLVGLQGERIQLRMHFCLLPYEWIRALEIVCERLEVGLTAIAPQQMAYGLPLTEPELLLIILEDHCTTVSVVRHGQLEWTGLVEIGEQEMVSRTGSRLGLPERQAGAMMRAYRGGELREDVELQVAATLWVELRKWMAAVGDTALQGLRNPRAPGHVYFLDQTGRMPEAQPSLKTPFWEEQLPFGRCPEVRTLSIGDVDDVLDCTAQAGSTEFLMVRAVAHYVAQIFVPGRNVARELIRTITRR